MTMQQSGCACLAGVSFIMLFWTLIWYVSETEKCKSWFYKRYLWFTNSYSPEEYKELWNEIDNLYISMENKEIKNKVKIFLINGHYELTLFYNFHI